MKKNLISLLAVSSLYFAGCREEEKIRLPQTTLGIIPTISVQPGREVFDSTNKANAEIAFDLNYNNFGGNLRAEAIVVKVTRVATINAVESNPAAATARVYTTVTEFPGTVTIRLAEVARLLNVNVNSILAANAIDVNFEVRASNGVTYSAASNNNAGVNTIYQLGTFRRRFFIGCQSTVLPGRYTATASVRVGPNGQPASYTNEVQINRQVITLDANTWLNFLPDIYTITDLSGGFYEGNPAFPNTAGNQPIGIREACGGIFSLFNNALLTLPSPNPQRTFTITGGSWNAGANTLTLTWRDGAANGAATVFGTTTYVRTGD